MIARHFCFLAVLTAFSASIALGQSEISVHVDVDKSVITIGELIEIRFTIRHPPGIKITESIAARHLEPFTIKKSEIISPYEEGGNIVEGRAFKITAYELGDSMIQPVEVKYVDHDLTLKSVFSNAVSVTVKSVDPSRLPGSDIRGLKGVKFLPKELSIALAILLVLGVIAASLMAVIYLRRKRAHLPPEKILTPAERALEALKELVKSGYLLDGRIKIFYGEISIILRRYLEEQFGFPALESTTREIQRIVSKRDWDQTVYKMLLKILEECDVVKFTDYLPPQSALHQTSKRAEEVINLTQAFADNVGSRAAAAGG